MWQSSKVLAVLIAALVGPFLAAPALAVTYHVRVNGNDNSCTGQVDAGYPGSGSGQPCAFRTPQRAINAINPGDDVTIHQGSYSGFSIPAQFQATSGNQTIIQGDPAVSRDLIVIDAGSSSEAIYSAGGGSSSTRTKFVTIQHLTVDSGNSFGINLDNEHDDMTLRDLKMNGFGNICCTQSSPRASAIRALISMRATIEDIDVLGHTNTCRLGTCGTDAMTIFLAGHNNVIRRVRSENMLGSFLQENGNQNIIEDNVIINSTCDGDDGCIQIYHDTQVVVRRNRFINMIPVDGAAVVRLRKTGSTPPSAQVYNNTFVAGTTGPSHLRMNGFWIASAGGGLTIVKNNIFVGFGNSGYVDGAAVLIGACPITLDVDNNLYYNNASGSDFANNAGCSGSFNSNSIFANPQLDPVTWAPAVGSPACAGGDTGYTNWDGDQADSHIGALPCAGGAGEPVPNAGPDIDQDTSGSIVMNGSATDSDGNMTNLSWSVSPSGCGVSQGSLSNNGTNASRNVTLNSCSDGVYTGTLTATDPSTSTSDTAFVTKDTAPPTPAPSASAALAGAQVIVTWNASTDALTGTKDYQVFRSANGGSFQSLGYVPSTTYTDQTALPLSSYRYRVTARDNFDNETAQGTISNEVTTPNTATLILRQGVSGYTGTEDNWLMGPDDPSQSAGPNDMRWNRGEEEIFASGNGIPTPNGKPSRSLIRFGNLSGLIPGGGTISNATLTLTCVGGGSGSHDFGLYRVLKPWTEGNGTDWTTDFDIASSWLGWSASAQWGAQGAANASNSGTDNTGNGSGFDRWSTPEDLATVGSCSNTSVSWDVTAAVANWVSGAWQNNGLLVYSPDENQGISVRQFASSENVTVGLRPQLNITYVVSGGGGDTTPPSTSVTSPGSGATVSGTTTVSANATDNIGVTGVQFRLDGANLGSEDTVAPWSISWDTTASSNGNHTLTSVARDAAGNTTISAGVSVTVDNAVASCGQTPLPGTPEGFGGNTTGGAGQPVVCVTNLNDSGPGSLREALSGSNRRVHFAVGGSINLASKLPLRNQVNVTVDGSTARALGGVSLVGEQLEIRDSSNIIVRHLRSRDTADTANNLNGFTVWQNCDNVWLDHLSVSRASDDSILVYEGPTNVTVSYCLVYDSDSIFSPVDPTPEAMLISGTGSVYADRVSVHHNVLTQNAERNPSISGNQTGGLGPTVDLRNNIIHDWNTYGTRFRWNATGNVVKNVYRSTLNPGSSLLFELAGPVYTSGNDAPTNIDALGNTGTPITAPAITEHTVAQLLQPPGSNPVLDDVGAFPRDTIDASAIATLAAVLAGGGGDTTPPSVTVTAPSGVTGGVVPVTASASDNVGVVGVQFLLDGANLGAEDTSNPWSVTWNTTTLPNGSYTLTAVARDGAGNTATSAPVVVTVNNDTTPPNPPANVRIP